MSSFKKQKEELIFNINFSENQIERLEKELVQIKEEKYSYKRKNDYPKLDKTVDKQIIVENKIKFYKHEIHILQQKLKDLEIEEKRSHKRRKQMDDVLGYMAIGKNRQEASKKSGVALSKIYKWYDNGKKGTGPDFIYFYDKVRFYESFYLDFFHVLRMEFKKKNRIQLYDDFVPKNYPKRLERFYNEGTLLWFSMLEIDYNRSLYYFGLKHDKFPRLILAFDRNRNESNFRLYRDDVLILLKLNNIDEFKNEFKLYVKDADSNLYYVSLGRFDSGEISKKIELLMRYYISDFSNPLNVF